MKKGIKEDSVSKKNLLGFDTEFDLYTKLFEKSVLVFPEYETRARKGICKHTVKFITSDVYSSGKFVTFSPASNTRVFYHLKKLAEKGFISHASGRRKGKIRFDINKIKTGWLELDHQKTKDEFISEAVDRVNNSIEDIKSKVKSLSVEHDILVVLSDVASSLEILADDLESYNYGRSKDTEKDGAQVR